MRPMSSEMTGRVSVGIGSSDPTMLLPPPNGMMTASLATARSTMRCVALSSAG